MPDWQAIQLTLGLAVVTTLILVAIGLPFAWWLATTGCRWRAGIEAVAALPIVLPPTVLGFYLLLLLGPKGMLGSVAESLWGVRLVFSFPGMVIASVIYSLPFAIQPFLAGFRSIDRRQVEASWCLGVSPLATFFRIVLPLSWPGVMAGIVLSFAHTVGEFGVVLMVGGNIPGATRTVSMAIYDSVQAMDYVTAGWTAGVLLVFSLAVLSVMYSLQNRTRSVIWPKVS